MSSLKTKLRALLLGCLSPEESLLSLETQTTHSSCSRLSFFYLSSSCSSFTALDISNSLVGSKLGIFTLVELQQITQNFLRSNFLGEGGFGPVYKGFINEKMKPELEAQTVAVKLMDLDGSQGHREWLAEIIFLGQLRHPNLVKLIGYCCEDEHRLLVYEYMTRGNLENQLFKKYCISLPWQRRMKIALGAAKGLAFLHEEENPVIFRDLKSSNILLDAEYNPKLSDFGLATDDPQVGETNVTTRVMGTKGYAAPEYLMTGHLTTMSDVFSFGVVLLELITGRRTIDEKRPKREQNLVEWARHILKDPQKMDRLIDPRLEGQYPIEGAKIAASVAQRCLRRTAKSRPTMRNVVKILEPLVNDDFQSTNFVYIVPNENREEKFLHEKGNSDEKDFEIERVGNGSEGEEKETSWTRSIFYGHRSRSSKTHVDFSEYSSIW